MSEKKYFILDTNVFLDDPEAIYQFDDNVVVIPNIVLEEIDKFKKEQSERGANARSINRILNNLELNDLPTGVKINDQGGKVKVQLLTQSIMALVKEKLVDNTNDNIILATALMYQETNDHSVILISNDVNLRVRAGVFGIKTAAYEIKIDSEYKGFQEKNIEDIPDEVLENIYSIKDSKPIIIEGDYFQNEFLSIIDSKNKKNINLIYKGNSFHLFKDSFKVGGIDARSKQQQFAFHLLLNDEIDCVSLIGKAGTGKTLLALAAGLEQTINQHKFDKIVVARPTYSMGPEIGFLPGTLEEKIEPWMKPIFDALDFLFNNKNSKNGDNIYGSKDKQSSKMKPYDLLFENGTIEIEALQYIRGRTLTNKFIIIDESQNLTQREIKTIITRLGEGSKIVFTGDVDQIDNPYLTKTSCGLSYINSRFRDKEICGSIVLPKNERSRLSGLAAKLL